MRTISGSIWQGTARLELETSIGIAEGDEAYLLGDVRGYAICDNHICILDGQTRSVRIYDLDGRHVRDLGRTGAGPGELRNPRGIAWDRVNHHLFVRDVRLLRLNVYTLDGSPVTHWPIPQMEALANPPVVGVDNQVYLPIHLSSPLDVLDTSEGVIVLGPEGATGDTLLLPTIDHTPMNFYSLEGLINFPVPFAPRYIWAVDADGTLVCGVSNDYRFEVHNRASGRLIIEKEYIPVQTKREEREWWREAWTMVITSNDEDWSWNGPPVPRKKQPFKFIALDPAGRIWVWRSGPGVYQDHMDATEASVLDPLWLEETVVDVFLYSGEYLGELQIPGDVLPGDPPFKPRPVISGGKVLLYTQSEDGTPIVNCYQLIEPN